MSRRWARPRRLDGHYRSERPPGLRIHVTDITIVESNDPLSTIKADEDPWAGSRSLGVGFTTIGIFAEAELGRLRRSLSDTRCDLD